MNQKILLNSEEDTKKFATVFARKLKKGDVLELVGDLGSGKTFFVRALSEALGAENISSPSFVIKNEYKGDLPIKHFDFYRLEDLSMIAEELREDLDSRNSLIMVEWGQSVEDVLPDDRYKIYFQVTGENSRKLSINK